MGDLADLYAYVTEHLGTLSRSEPHADFYVGVSSS
jgi:hypothetical protein